MRRCRRVRIAQASRAAGALDKAARGQLREILRSGDMDGKAGSTRMLYRVRGVSAQRIPSRGASARRRGSARSSIGTARAPRSWPPIVTKEDNSLDFH